MVVPGARGKIPRLRNGACAANAPALSSTTALESTLSSTARDDLRARLVSPGDQLSTHGRYVFYTQDKPWGSVSAVTFGINLVQDDQRLPKRHTVGGSSGWRTWPKDLQVAQAEKSILGPVVDRRTRELFYFRSNDCDLAGVCGDWDLVSLSFATGAETVLYTNKPWEFPSSSAFLTGTFAGRSVVTYDEASRVLFFTAVPRNSVQEIQLFSLHLGPAPDPSLPSGAPYNALHSPTLHRLGDPKTELKHCQIKLRHTWNRENGNRDHVAYNALAAPGFEDTLVSFPLSGAFGTFFTLPLSSC